MQNLKMRKQNFKCLVFFKSDRPVCNHLNVSLMKTNLKTIFFFKKIDFCIFNSKKLKEKKTVQNTAKRLPIKMHIYRQKIISILLAFGQK